MGTWVSAIVAIIELVTIILREAQRERDIAQATLNLTKELSAHANAVIAKANAARAASLAATADPSRVFAPDANERPD